MAGENDDTIINEIKEKYVPFLKKLISFLEKTQKATPENLSRLKSIHTVFTSASVVEQIEVFHTNKKKLEKWYKNSQKDKVQDDGTKKYTKRAIDVEDTDSSQGASEVAAKKIKVTEPTISSVRSVSAPSSTFDANVIVQIKKEKTDQPKGTQQPQPNLTAAPSIVKIAPEPSQTTPVIASNENDQSSVIFTCASCQFQTDEEQEFMKHTRTDHRSDLSMWCKQCGKCFSNAGVLVSHIKERACLREEMIYRCGVKDCTFETNSGQTFVHHLRHCHKGSPFIFCVHCQKIFTLPHCLILHMQDDCPFKERNRRNPSAVSSQPPAKHTSSKTSTAPVVPVQRPIVSFTPRPPTISSVVSTTPKPTPPSSDTPRAPVPRGRGRGRGRGKVRFRATSDDSSDSDADDPLWHPEETTDQLTLRRSGRWAKKINDVINVAPKQQSKLSLSELHEKEMLKCPCCDFLAAFNSVLQDHYIAHHKVPNKNACLVCHLKFESTAFFLDHFADHASGKLIEMDVNELPIENAVNKSAKKVVSSAHTSVNNSSKQVQQYSSLASIDKELYKDVVQSLSEANVRDPTSGETTCVKIPYQAAIHDKLVKESKSQKFEHLKSSNDLLVMRSPEKLRCFYKCVMLNCVFTSDDSNAYLNHLDNLHKGKKFLCCYCLEEYLIAKELTHHMVSEHGKRQYQCSCCFYRAYSKIHVQIHIKHHHPKESSTEVYTCDQVKIPSCIQVKCNLNEISNTIWPYICALGQCSFQCFDSGEFKIHNETNHRTVSVYFCHYCKVEFISFKRLLNHYRLHGINTFQCNYCIHGSETKDDILLHLCNLHMDQPLRAFMRGSVEDVSTDTKVFPYSETNSSVKVNDVDSSRSESPSGENADANLEAILYEVVGDTYYPRHLNKVCSDFTCGVPWCLEKFQTMLSYIKHLGNVHSSRNFSCPHCPCISKTLGSFKDHLMCHGPELYACGLVTCNFHHWNKTAVAKHLNEHEQNGIKVVIIRESNMKTDEANNLEEVEALPKTWPFTISKASYRCFFCRYKCTDKRTMKNHMYSEMMYKRFNCNYCNKKFVSREEIKDHSISQHSEDIKCSIDSNPVIETIIKKIIHQKIKSPDPKSISCPVCNKNFKSAIQWQRHMCLCVRKSYQPYDCEHCSFSASDLKILKFHTDKKHPGKPVLYTEIASHVVEEEIEKSLQRVRLAYLNKILYTEKYANESQKHCFVKFYLCSSCSNESNHKYNIQTHIKKSHEGIAAEVTKVLRKNSDSLSYPVSNNTPPIDTTNSTKKLSSGAKRYRCGFCIKKLHTLEELKNHVESLHHVRDEIEYFYYYSPDPNVSFPLSDQELYECSYCKSGKENLHSLKKHSDLMHSESPFKVRGYVIRNQDKSSFLACGYCYLRMDGMLELKRHSAAEHQPHSVKALGGYSSVIKKKREHEESDEFPFKKVKFGSDVYVCSHCGGAYSNPEDVTTHCRKSHSRLPLDFTKRNLYLSEESSSGEFYKCEFCKFTSEKEYLDIHLKTKHKMRVTCGYCNKRFEFATKLREHHNVFHKKLPIKYSQETVGSTFNKKERLHSVSSDDLQSSNHASEVQTSDISSVTATSFCGKLDPIDLSQIYINTCDSNSTKISVLTFSKKCNIFPKVCLEDIKCQK